MSFVCLDQKQTFWIIIIASYFLVIKNGDWFPHCQSHVVNSNTRMVTNSLNVKATSMLSIVTLKLHVVEQVHVKTSCALINKDLTFIINWFLGKIILKMKLLPQATLLTNINNTYPGLCVWVISLNKLCYIWQVAC